MGSIPVIRFKHRVLAELRSALLTKDGKENFAVLLARREVIGNVEVFTVRDMRIPGHIDYIERKRAFLRLQKTFSHQVLAELVNRMDVDTLIDVHTHPFSEDFVHFSGMDDSDEKGFMGFLKERFDGIHYASIVFSQNRYQARVWTNQKNHFLPIRAAIKTQTMPECIPETGETTRMHRDAETQQLISLNAVYNRSTLALGLDVMRAITSRQTIALAGVGGIGSIAAEHLVHLGFQRLVLIDPDTLDQSNMNRFVGATMDQAVTNLKKVDAVRDHLQAINPDVKIITCAEGVEGENAKELMAGSDWIILSTDNHSSRSEVQKLALRFFVPMISAGVNITVSNGTILDMSGEVITVRAGDKRCLNCLGRINLARMAAESHPDPEVRKRTVQRGYVEGYNVKEPAVKTLNAILASLAVDRLVDQFFPDRRDIPILVYENNGARSIYEDRTTMENRNPNGCAVCDL